MDGPAGDDSAVIRIILADPQIVYRVGILQLLASEIDMQVVAQTNTMDGLRRAVGRFFIQSPTQRRFTSSVILLANNMISGTADFISELVRRSPQSKVITQLNEKDEYDAVDLYRRGVSGIISRSIPPELLVKCVRKVAAGEVWIDNQSVNRLIEAFRFQTTAQGGLQNQLGLSSKELSIVTFITQGKHNKEIAFQLGTTEQVIKNYLRKIYDKLGVTHRIELARYGLRHELHKRASGPGFLGSTSVPGPDFQNKPNGACRA
jgi:two-component system, NarL family, nitrate/nitrite response regulator NarL